MYGIKQSIQIFPAASPAEGLRLCPDVVQGLFYQRNSRLSDLVG